MTRPDKPIFRFYLRAYRRQGAAVFQKARIQLILLLVTILSISLFILHDYILRGTNQSPLLISLVIGLVFVSILTFVLRTGHYLVSGHLLLVTVFSIIWHELFFGFASVPLTRLDTIVLLAAALPMTPLLTNKRGLALHLAVNIILLGVFIAANPEAKLLGPGELDAYAMDAFLGISVSALAAYLLTRTSERGRRRIESMNVNLEEKVLLRTNALRRATDDLRASRNAMHRDMEMARHAQQTMQCREPPPVSGWDIAHFFRPMAQVSGDFYDFYEDAHDLRGVSLFDVSGHGIASGLITILARSIILRAFNDVESPPLEDILKNANDELIANLEGVYNYLSGVVVRFQGDMMEYANAGHPDLLLKSADRPCEIVAPPDGEAYRGGLMGIETLRGTYPIIHRRVNPGDALLLYSDGITEAENSRGEPYGMERLKAALNDARGPARERVEALLTEHGRFTEHRGYADDVTVLLLVRE